MIKDSTRTSLREEIHEANKAKGYWDNPNSLKELSTEKQY